MTVLSPSTSVSVHSNPSVSRDHTKTWNRPHPNRLLMSALGVLNRNLLLRGFAPVRWIPFVRDLPFLRGYFRVRRVEIPAADLATLRKVVNPGTAAFIGPNHPEFGCDWMIDKEISMIVAPHMASWADRGIVAAAPGFWGMNNLVANDGGDAAREYSIECALKGDGVLLHPEGTVRWTSDHVHPLFPGIAQMAVAAAERSPRQPVYMVPLVWKLVYVGDISRALHRDMRALEDGLGVFRGDGGSIAERFAALQENVLETRMRKFGYEPIGQGDFFARQAAFQRYIVDVLETRYDAGDADTLDRQIARIAKLIRQRRSDLRGDDSPEAVAERGQLKQDAELAEEAKRLGEFTREVYGGPTLTQEHVGESLKRMRDRLLNRTRSHRMANMLPRPFGARVAYVGVPEPVHVKRVPDDDKVGYERRLLVEMRGSMQARLDEINSSVESIVKPHRVPNLLLGS